MRLSRTAESFAYQLRGYSPRFFEGVRIFWFPSFRPNISKSKLISRCFMPTLRPTQQHKFWPGTQLPRLHSLSILHTHSCTLRVQISLWHWLNSHNQKYCAICFAKFDPRHSVTAADRFNRFFFQLISTPFRTWTHFDSDSGCTRVTWIH